MIAAALLLCWTVGCRDSSGVAREEDELRESFGIATDVEIHEVLLGEGTAADGVEPDSLEISPGSVVLFRTVDDRVHTVTFPPEDQDPGPGDFLARTRQDASPPLIEKGSTFVLTFAEAPPGRYPFVGEAHGSSRRGVIVVKEE